MTLVECNAESIALDRADATDARTFTSVGKALAILEAFEGSAALLGVSEVARRTQLTKSTAFRLLTLLESWRYVERRDDRYCLGKRLFELGNQVTWCRPRNLRDIALPYMGDLFALTKRTIHLAVLDGIDVLYVEKLQGHEKPEPPTRVGGRVSARTTALGKAILAFSEEDTVQAALTFQPTHRTLHTILLPHLFQDELQEVRRVGVAYDREEVRLGVTCVAAPILRHGRPLGAISVSGNTHDFDPPSVARRVRSTADAIAMRLQP